jgi:uncharacterized membrane protein (UPF0127 family)
MKAQSNYIVEMTVKADVQENTWGAVDYAGAAGAVAPAVAPVVGFVRKYLPFLLITALVGGTILFAMSCNGSTVAFSNDSRSASLDIQVANTASERSSGLMGRTELAENGGMLFDFGGATDTAFYMKDTSIPLSIAFIDSRGRVLAIKDMKPFNLTPVQSPDKYRYAIEANQGWFVKHGITPGSRATIDI